jgi:hypothetical protein
MAEESVQMCLGEYNCATGKSSEKPCYTTWAGIHYARIYHWPQSNMRLLPVEGSDVSDQVLVYDLNRHKKLTPKWLTDQWKERYLNQAAIFNLTPGPHGLLGVYAVGEKGDTCIINTSTNSVDHISTNGGGPITFSKDGSFMAWDEGTYIWIARVSDKRAQKLCSGYEPAWRP